VHNNKKTIQAMIFIEVSAYIKLLQNAKHHLILNKRDVKERVHSLTHLRTIIHSLQYVCLTTDYHPTKTHTTMMKSLLTKKSFFLAGI
jgi:hypothetical protein